MSDRTSAHAATDEGTFNQDLSKALSCASGATFDATGNVGLKATPTFSLSWSLFHGVSASFTETVTASASLSGSLSGSANCTFDRIAVLAHPIELGTFVGDVFGIPIVVTIRGQLYLDGEANAQGSISAGVDGQLTARGGISYKGGHASVISPNASLSFGVQGPNVQASASLGAHVTRTAGTALRSRRTGVRRDNRPGLLRQHNGESVVDSDRATDGNGQPPSP